MTIKNALGDINMDIWNSVPMDCYSVPTNENELKETTKEVKQGQQFITDTVLLGFWKLALRKTD